mmetsp:Transcript_24973/g.67903  ORF Transcript_24973/g.67903 Transcript_24973/m.67903 type:complete len:211 (+) Transcript_24973:4861-5493(+)
MPPSALLKPTTRGTETVTTVNKVCLISISNDARLSNGSRAKQSRCGWRAAAATCCHSCRPGEFLFRVCVAFQNPLITSKCEDVSNINRSITSQADHQSFPILLCHTARSTRPQHFRGCGVENALTRNIEGACQLIEPHHDCISIVGKFSTIKLQADPKTHASAGITCQLRLVCGCIDFAFQISPAGGKCGSALKTCCAVVCIVIVVTDIF